MKSQIILPKALYYYSSYRDYDIYRIMDILSEDYYCITFSEKSYFNRQKFRNDFFLQNNEFFKIIFKEQMYISLERIYVDVYKIRQLSKADKDFVKSEYPEHLI